MLQLMRKDCSYTYPPLSIARYSFIHLSELEQCRVKVLSQGFNTAAQDSNPGPLSQESEALPPSYCILNSELLASPGCCFFLYDSIAFLSLREELECIVEWTMSAIILDFHCIDRLRR